MGELEANKAVAQRWIDAVNRRDREAFAALLHDNLEMWVPGNWQLSGRHSKAGWLQLIDSHVVALDDPVQITARTFTAESNRVAVVAQATARHSGRTYEQTFHFLFVIEGEQIIRFEEHLDSKAAVDFFFAEPQRT